MSVKKIFFFLLLLLSVLQLPICLGQEIMNGGQDCSGGNLRSLQTLLPEAETGFFPGRGGVPLAYAVWPAPRPSASLLLINGRNETFVKYLHVMSSLRQAGFSLYAFDHRGQGFSARLLQDPHKGHVDAFSDYSADLGSFLDRIVLPRSSGEPLYALAHSLGGTVLLHYVLERPKTFTALALSAPMLGFSTRPWPAFLVPPLLALLDFCGLDNSYIIGGGPFRPEVFTADNPLTGDAENYNENQRLMQDYPALQLGAPTNNWVRESLGAIGEIQNRAAELKIPILLLQAEDERVVDNQAQRLFSRRAPDCNLLPVNDARHEILMEKNAIRQHVLRLIIDFYREHR